MYLSGFGAEIATKGGQATYEQCMANVKAILDAGGNLDVDAAIAGCAKLRKVSAAEAPALVPAGGSGQTSVIAPTVVTTVSARGGSSLSPSPLSVRLLGLPLPVVAVGGAIAVVGAWYLLRDRKSSGLSGYHKRRRRNRR